MCDAQPLFHNKRCQPKREQCDQIWRFFKIICVKVSFKISPNVSWLYRLFENIPFQIKTAVATFWAPFGIHWATFLFQHLVTPSEGLLANGSWPSCTPSLAICRHNCRQNIFWPFVSRWRWTVWKSCRITVTLSLQCDLPSYDPIIASATVLALSIWDENHESNWQCKFLANRYHVTSNYVSRLQIKTRQLILIKTNSCLHLA